MTLRGHKESLYNDCVIHVGPRNKTNRFASDVFEHTYKESKYYFAKPKKDRASAMAHCQARGTSLVKIDSFEEQGFITALAYMHGGDNYTIGNDYLPSLENPKDEGTVHRKKFANILYTVWYRVIHENTSHLYRSFRKFWGRF